MTSSHFILQDILHSNESCCCTHHCLHVSEQRAQAHTPHVRGAPWMSFGGQYCWKERERDKCGGQGLRRAWQLQGRRSSWAEYIYRAAFLRIRLLSNWAPVAPRHPLPPVVGDLCSHLDVLYVSTNVATFKSFKYIIKNTYVTLLK